MQNVCVFFYFFIVQKLSLAKDYFLIAAKNLTTRGPLYTCLVRVEKLISVHSCPLFPVAGLSVPLYIPRRLLNEIFYLLHEVRVSYGYNVTLLD